MSNCFKSESDEFLIDIPDDAISFDINNIHDEKTEEIDLNTILVRSIETPDHSKLTINDTIHQLKMNARKQKTFKDMLKRVNMSIWTLRFCHNYEKAFCTYLHHHSVLRIRQTMAIGLFFIFSKCIYDYVHLLPIDKNAHAWKVSLKLHTFLVLPSMFFAYCCTFRARFNTYREYYATFPFLALTGVLTAQKILDRSTGPILSLYMTFLPVFCITRFRFTTSIVLGTCMFLIHFVCLFTSKIETTSDILFQGFNYLGGIVVGAICHYREEVLRRRNFIMHLPFLDAFDEVKLHENLEDPKIKRENFLNKITLKFNNSAVEEGFYRYWYLIDACPFDHPNAGDLHRGAFRTIRFSVGGAIFSQLLLAVQDYEYFFERATEDQNAYSIASALRFGAIIPAYSIAPVLMYWIAKRYYQEWRRQAGSENRGGIRTHRRRSSYFCRESSMREPLCATSPNLPMSWQTTYSKDFRKHYVRYMQWISSGVVFIHMIGAGVLLVLLDRNKHFGAVQCYFIGFLNAILFPHRSGFRMRFLYASIATGVISCSFITIFFIDKRPQMFSYSSYLLLANVLGMMISYEEEGLRRCFFVRRAIRSEEFKEYYDAIVRIEDWLRPVVRARRKSVLLEKIKDIEEGETKYSLKIPTVKQMGQASKYGMIFEVGKIVVAAATELV